MNKLFNSGKISIYRPYFWLALAVIIKITATSEFNAQDLDAFTKTGPLRVLLSWAYDSTASGIRYNIYRKPALDVSYPSTPINTSPVGPITICADFKVVIPMASTDWVLIANAFADTLTNVPLADVCSLTSFPVGSKQWKRAVILSSARPNIARVMGLAYLDNGVVLGTSYKYQVRRVSELGTELALTGANEVTITAGTPGVIPVAANVRRVIGDAMIQILWNKPVGKYSAFNVYRSILPLGPYTKVNEADISTVVSLDIDSNDVVPESIGFTDYERWDTLGNPSPRLVLGVPVSGPVNGTKYYYKVKLKDILGNEGPFSAQVDGTPVDKTPPTAPQGVIVIPDEATSSFRIKWPNIKYDVYGHVEKMGNYKVYRYTSPENPDSGATELPGVVPQPVPPDTITWLIKTDNSGGLRNDCRDAVYYFRVEAIDDAGNVSYRSIAVSGSLKDTTRPKSPKGTNAEGFDDHIRIKWMLNEECDTNVYLIYRAYCDYGEWVPCDTTRKTYQDSIRSHEYKPKDPKDLKKPEDCGGPFVLLGTLTYSDAKARSIGGETYFDDYKIPAGSPLCYAYLVKAQDLSQNISGKFPMPDLADEIIVCQRLRDRTPPEAGIISGLFALDSAIKVEFIGPPIQDIAAYHIYRSDNGEFGTYNWAGGMTVEPPPLVGVVLTSKYVPPPVVGCDMIPLVSNEYMSAGTFIDKKAEQKKIYWYKALGVDRNGNETPVDSAAGISTFTFATNREPAPEISAIAPTDDPCALTLTWTLLFDASSMMGFIVFRSNIEAGPYFQLDNVIKGNSFADNSVARNKTYWYRIALLKKDGSLSKLSQPKNGIHP